ncbi:unnamed protein product [Ascophyllum nodosum]
MAMTRITALLTCFTPSVLLAAALPGSLRRPQGDTKATVIARRRLATSDLEPAVDEEGYYAHVGCYMDKEDDRVLGVKLVRDDTTAELCHEYCNVRGAFYMATQYGNECFCSEEGDLDYDRHSTGVCDQPCAGDDSERCGGFYAFDLYELVWPDTPTDLEYMDCYADDMEERIMSNMYASDDMTSAVCRDHCKESNALYYATQFGNECWCGTSDVFADYEKHGKGTCHMRCAGDTSTACGGIYAFSLYRLIDESPEPAPAPEPTPEPTPEPSSKSTEEVGSVNYANSYPFDGTTFSGDGTYYGETSNGNCAIMPIPSMYSGMIPVALNAGQYGGSEMCGACIEGEGSGNGAGSDPITGTFKAYVMDKCPECSTGDLDFSKSGDGRWDISWKFVACPGSDKPSFIFEGSHEYFWKIQPRGTKTPVTELTVDGASGVKTDDNFFEIPGAPYPLYGAQTVKTTTMLGKTATQEVSL